MFGGLRQRRHDIGEGAEYSAIDAQRAALKSLRGEAPASRLQQRQAGLERERECAATRLDPLNTLRRGGAGLNDVSHTDLAASNGATGNICRVLLTLAARSQIPRNGDPGIVIGDAWII